MGKVTLHEGDCLEVMPKIASSGMLFDACITDPPYHLKTMTARFGKPNSAPAKYGTNSAFAAFSKGFMGQKWDGGDIAFRAETWRHVYDLLKPGAHLLAFGGTRTYHRLVCAIEDAGFEIRDCITWLYGSGFPKSQDVAKALDRRAGVEGKYGEIKHAQRLTDLKRGSGSVGKAEGWARPWMDDPKKIEDNAKAYKPASDLGQRYYGWGTALKPAQELICVARKPLIGTVAENIAQYGTGALNIESCRAGNDSVGSKGMITKGYGGWQKTEPRPKNGRWPANVIHDGSAEVTDDLGDAARFFYCAKAGENDRIGTSHPTVKPLALLGYLVRLITPQGGLILDPFAGSGTTGIAARDAGFEAHLIEREPLYAAEIRARLDLFDDHFIASSTMELNSKSAESVSAPLLEYASL